MERKQRCKNVILLGKEKIYRKKKWSEKTLSKTIVKELIEKGETKIIKGFKSKKTGKKFDAKLKLSDGKLSFNFDKGE